jgi:hypothetical protein
MMKKKKKKKKKVIEENSKPTNHSWLQVGGVVAELLHSLSATYEMKCR